jgi:plasmid maintenance system antidote protein VapI
LAKVSHHTIAALRAGENITDAALLRLAASVDEFQKTYTDEDDVYWMELLRRKRDELGSDAALAEFLGISRPYATRLLNGERRLTKRLKKVMDKVRLPT